MFCKIDSWILVQGQNHGITTPPLLRLRLRARNPSQRFLHSRPQQQPPPLPLPTPHLLLIGFRPPVPARPLVRPKPQLPSSPPQRPIPEFHLKNPKKTHFPPKPKPLPNPPSPLLPLQKYSDCRRRRIQPNSHQKYSQSPRPNHTNFPSKRR